jgi:S1-C subfamily serine protease
MGYPLNDNNTEVVTEVWGNLMAFEYHDSLNTPIGCLQLSADINPGNSGGPVFAKIGDEIKVIGIVSKADGRANQGMFWAVPVTEVLNMHKQSDRIVEDSVTYRR